MTDEDLRKRAHELDVTLRIGKRGLDPITDELNRQLKDTDLVKAKFLRSARGGSDVEELAEELAESANANLVETRGNTAVFQR
jgi:RNA-binding protein